MILKQFDNGDILEKHEKALIARFAGPRRVLSTSALNGGGRDDLLYAFNQDCKERGNKNVPLKAPTYEEHLKLVAAELGPDPRFTCGVTTAADIENVSFAAETYDNITVTAAATGGIDVNGGRVGDPADWHESAGVSVKAADGPPATDRSPASGTINILLFISARLTEGAAARALVTCTEAMTAALQELLAPSCYSSGIATGSGTDGTIIMSDLTSPVSLTFAGKHSKLGELIGRTVMNAVKEALYRQTGLGPAQQFDIFSRIGRYGVTRERMLSERPDADAVMLDKLERQRGLVVITSLYVHLLDQLTWGLITARDAVPAANRLLRDMGMDVCVSAAHPDARSAVGEMLAVYEQGFINKLI